MTVHPFVYSAWIVFGILFLGLQVYRSTLTRYEDEKLFLDGLDQDGERSQNEIIRKVTRIQPLVNLIGTATAIMSLGIVGVYVYNAILVIRS
jgi:hypothetical protein